MKHFVTVRMTCSCLFALFSSNTPIKHVVRMNNKFDGDLVFSLQCCRENKGID